MKRPKNKITKTALPDLVSTTAEELLNNITPNLEDGQLVNLTGAMEINGITLRFSLNRQAAESSRPYRGTISMLAPATGRIMKAIGTDRRRRVTALKEKRAKRNGGESNSSSAVTNQAGCAANSASDNILLRRQIGFRSKRFAANAPYSDIREELAEYLVDQGKKLFNEYCSTVYNCVRESITPKTITPLFALMLYYDRFISETRDKMKDEVRKRLKKELELLLNQLPEKSMCSFIKRDFRNNARFRKLSGAKIKVLFDFWEYCISEHYCDAMDNPIPLPEKRAESELARMKAASTPRTLSSEQIDILYRYCLDAHNGLACGICLLLNGYTEDFARKLKWKDVVFKNDHLVLILNNQAERAAATKDYTRPCNKLLGELLRQRYQNLLKSGKDTGKYTEKKLKEMPVVSGKSPATVLTNKVFVEKCSSVLGKCGVPPEVFQNLQGKRCAAAKLLLRNTYEYLVCSGMGIDDDEGTKSFLLGRMLESTTDNNYVSYTSPEASERLYAIQNRCLPAYDLPQEKTVTDLGNGMVQVTLNPRNTRETLAVTLKEDFLPDVQISASARHGVSAMARVRELKEDGTPKRASRKKQSN